jgi:hypothetical protein
MSKPFKISAEYAAPRFRTKTAMASAGACVGLRGIRISRLNDYRQISQDTPSFRAQGPGHRFAGPPRSRGFRVRLIPPGNRTCLPARSRPCLLSPPTLRVELTQGVVLLVRASKTKSAKRASISD